jgi:hypothetical protein
MRERGDPCIPDGNCGQIPIVQFYCLGVKKRGKGITLTALSGATHAAGKMLLNLFTEHVNSKNKLFQQEQIQARTTTRFKKNTE